MGGDRVSARNAGITKEGSGSFPFKTKDSGHAYLRVLTLAPSLFKRSAACLNSFFGGVIMSQRKHYN
jgi:hypothetical protein